MGSSDKHTADDGANIGRWLVNVSDDSVVPMTTLDVIDGLRAQRLSEQSLVWRIGMHDWSPISDVPQLRLAAGSHTPLSRATQPPSPDSARLTPVPSVVAPLTLEPVPSVMPHSLAPTTAEAGTGDGAHAPGAWDEFDELLVNERRADQRSSRRAVLAAALGSATLAAGFALWLLRSPAPHAPPPPEPRARAAQASDAPELAPRLEAVPPSSPSALEPTAPAGRAAPRSVPPRFTGRPKRAAPAASANDAALAVPAAPERAHVTGAPADVAVVPLAPLEPAPTPTTPTESEARDAAPLAPSAPDSR